MDTGHWTSICLVKNHQLIHSSNQIINNRVLEGGGFNMLGRLVDGPGYEKMRARVKKTQLFPADALGCRL